MLDFSGSISYYIEQFQLSYIRCTWSVFLKTLLMGSFSFLLSSRQLNRICDHRNLSLREFLKSLKLMILCTHHSYIWSQFQMFYEICFKKCQAFGSFRVVRYMEWDAAWSRWRKLSVGGYEQSDPYALEVDVVHRIQHITSSGLFSFKERHERWCQWAFKKHESWLFWVCSDSFLDKESAPVLINKASKASQMCTNLN